MSFEQWYNDVQCLKDHYSEAVVKENVIQSLKGAAADMARYMGPTTSIAHILHKLLVIFSMVTYFNILMQNFYTVSQGNNEKVPSFAMRLEGILNQIQLQCPGRMTDLETQQHLKDCLFHGIRKHICDSVWYLYSTPGTSNSQLMVANWKAKTESEETWEGVRARAVVTTKPEKGMANAQLMVVLTRMDRAAVLPVHQVLPGNVAADVGTVGGATQSPGLLQQ